MTHLGFGEKSSGNFWDFWMRFPEIFGDLGRSRSEIFGEKSFGNFWGEVVRKFFGIWGGNLDMGKMCQISHYSYYLQLLIKYLF
jgi:hypothetical protein